MNALPPLTDGTFHQTLTSTSLPLVVDFWAEWCGPCRLITPLLVELSAEFKGRARFMAVDVDANPQTAQHYGIRAIPTILIFRSGTVLREIKGLRNKPEIRKIVEECV